MSAATTGCECEHAGYCVRHRMEKTDHLVHLCRTAPRYMSLWDRTAGMLDEQLACDLLGSRAGVIDKVKAGCGCPDNQEIHACAAQGEQFAIRRPAGWFGVEIPVVTVPGGVIKWDGDQPGDRVSIRSCVGCPLRRIPRRIQPVTFSTWAVGVTTAARRVPRLSATLDSLLAAGWTRDEITVFAEPDAPVPEDWPTARATEQLGGWRNWLRALNELLKNEHADAIAIVQDDIIATPETRRFLDAVELPANTGVFSPYCSSVYRAEDGAAGPFRVNPPDFRGIKAFGFAGACFLVFPREVAIRIARDAFVAGYAENRYIDGVVGHVVTRRLQKSLYCHWPSLVQHVGDTSTLHGGATATGHRSANSWVAEVKADQFLPRKPRRDPKIGVIGWATNSGLGRLNWEACSHLPVERWLAPRHQRFPYVATHPDVDTWYCDSTANTAKLRAFLAGLDMVLTFELQYYGSLTTIARQMNVRTACVMMHECAPAGCRGWPQFTDLCILPNGEAKRQLSPALPRGNWIHQSWPIDTDLIPFRLRTTAERFFFGQGTGGGRDRKGGEIVAGAAALTPDVPWTVRSQIVDPKMRIFEVEYRFPDNVRLLGPTRTPGELYDEGDVAVQPSRYEGIGLQLLEAQAAGMPLITTDAAPMNEYNPLAVIRAGERRITVLRPTTAYDASHTHLAEIVASLHGKPIADASAAARDWVERTHSWHSCRDRIMSRFVDLCFPTD